MEKVIIDDLPENSFYHFTLEENLSQIEEKGLVPIIGENSEGIEETPKIFFSKGELGIIKATEVWLRWLMNRIYGVNDRLNMRQEMTEEEKNIHISEWTKEFLSGEYKNDKDKKEKLFEYFYKYLKGRIYLQLNMQDGNEYDSNDLDENKVRLQEQDYMYNAFAKVMYGEFSNMETPVMDDWNMHTKSNKGVEKDKIKQITTKDGKEDMLSIILYLYEKHKDIPHNHFLLDDFVEYAKNKEELDTMINEEGNEYDKGNYSRIY